MTTTPRSTVVGVFHDHERAREAIEALKKHDFPSDGISILTPDRDTTRDVAEETGTHAGSGAATGAVAGGILGGLGGWLVGIGALAIPGIGPFIAAGAFASALGGAALGAGVGAIAGALMGMGVPEEHAKYYEGEARAGRTLVTVRGDNRYDEAQRILREHGAYDIESGDRAATTGAAGMSAGTTGRPADAQRVSLREEELVARKESVQTGQVQVGKEVVSEQRTLDVPVTREEVYVERTPVDRRTSDREIDERGGRTIEVPLHEERVEVEKRPVVYEEVGVAKRQVQDTQHVSDTVRREEARIGQQGDVTMGGANWSDAMPGYRQRWQQRYGNTGGRWEDAEPGYRYGHELRSRDDYRGRSFSDLEPDLRRDWTQRNPSMPWDRAREHVRESYESESLT